MVAKRTIVAAAAAFLIIAFAASQVDHSPVETALPTSVRSLAVVALADTDSATQPLTHGIALEIARALRSVNGIRVVSADGKGRLDSQQLRRLLNVGAILEVRLRRLERGLRLELSLKGDGDSTLLVHTYRVSGDNLRGAEIVGATNVGDALRAQLGLPKLKRIRIAETRSREAHELLLRAWGRQLRTDSQARMEATRFLETALRFDGGYADVWSELAVASEATGDTARASLTARRAIELDSTLAAPHVVLADLRWLRRDTAGASREYLKAIRLDPQLPLARYRYSLMLSEVGRKNEALREARRAHELQPLVSDVHANYARMLARAGREPESRHEAAELRRVTGILRSAPAVSPARSRADYATPPQDSRSGARAERN